MITSELLSKFDNCLRSYCGYIYEYYQPPLSKLEIGHYARSMGIENADYNLIYEWRNGLDFGGPNAVPGEFSILFEGNFTSLRNALNQYREIQKGPAGYFWSPTQVVVMENLQGECLVLETDRKSPEYNFLHSYSPSGVNATKPISKYDSLSHLLESIIAVFEYKAIYYDDKSKCLEIDFEKQAEICLAINTNAVYWKQD